jgi:hypothetical protein
VRNSSGLEGKIRLLCAAASASGKVSHTAVKGRESIMRGFRAIQTERALVVQKPHHMMKLSLTW